MGDAARVRQSENDTPVDRLRAALVRLGDPRERLLQGMHTEARGHEQALWLIIEEIDETVLPRRMDLVAETGVVGSFIASNRRLIDLTVSEGAAAPRAFETNDPDEAAQHHVEAVRSIAEITGRLALRPAGRARKPGAGATSCSTRSLLRAGQAIGQDARLTRLLDRIAPHAEGWICDYGDGRESRGDGSAAVRERLKALDKALTGSHRRDGRPERLERAEPTCSVLAMGAGTQGIVARDGRSRVLACIRPSEVARVLDIWCTIYGSPGQGPGRPADR
jgi:hypothetical protein